MDDDSYDYYGGYDYYNYSYFGYGDYYDYDNATTNRTEGITSGSDTDDGNEEGGSASDEDSNANLSNTTDLFDESLEENRASVKKAFSKSKASSSKKEQKKVELRKTNAANSLLGLTVVLYANREQYSEVTMNNFFGFKVLVHSPYDFPEVGGKGFAIGEKKEAFVAVGATETSSTSDVLSMPLAKRECLKHDENMENYEDIVLQVFANYSQKACYLECEARALYSKCRCLPYYFPDFSRVYKNDTSCNVTGLRCLADQYCKTSPYFHKITHYFKTPFQQLLKS